jgi:uncharacterized protein with von Willebrand factor type A (vWA) domain
MAMGDDLHRCSRPHPRVATARLNDHPADRRGRRRDSRADNRGSFKRDLDLARPRWIERRSSHRDLVIPC